MSTRLNILSAAWLILLFVLTCAACLSQTASAQSGRWEVLFDGKSTQHWRGYKRDSFPVKGWTVEEGALKAVVGGDVVDIVTKEKYDNFELELEWKISPGGNSGIMYRVSEEVAEAWQTGPELQVLDDARHKDGGNPKTTAGALYALIAPTNKVLQPVGDWNKVRLVVNRNHVEHWLNGRRIVEYELGSPEFNALVAASKFSDKPRFAREKSGHIVLQHHQDAVWYRHIRIRRL